MRRILFGNNLSFSIAALVALCGFAILFNALHAGAQNKSDSTVEVQRFVLAINDGSHKYWRVKFQYAFPNQESIVLDGIGPIAPKGTLSFLTEQTVLRFLDSNGKLLRAVPLERTGNPEGAGIELPNANDFGPAFLSYNRKRAFMPNECGVILNGFFNSGYTVRQESKITFYTTAYQPLKEGVSKQKRAQVSLQVSSPYPAPPKNVAFRVQMIVRERGRGEEDDKWLYGDQVTEETHAAANKLHDVMVSKLENIP